MPPTSFLLQWKKEIGEKQIEREKLRRDLRPIRKGKIIFGRKLAYLLRIIPSRRAVSLILCK